jgi:SAM-dependent methyltransferase
MSYDIIAPFYDKVMDHVDYTEWYDLILSIVSKYRIKTPVSLLEIGGGTGTLGRMLTDKKNLFRYFGSDICLKMAVEARKKDLPFFCADGCAMPVKKTFDMIIFLYDGINYLQSLSAYRQLFASVSQCLKPNGFFLFDITTRENSLLHFYDFFDYQELGDTSVMRHSYFLPQKNLQKNDFLFFSPVDDKKDLYTKRFETHSQKVFSAEQLKKIFPQSPFFCRGIWDGCTMQPYNAASERIHFLLQKKSDD